MTPTDPSLIEPPENLRLHVLEAARRHPVPQRSESLLPNLGRAAFAAVAMVALLALWGGPSAAAGRPPVYGAWIVAGTLALALAATRLSLPSRRSMLSPARGRLVAVVIGVPALMGAWLLLWHAAYADPFVRVGLGCFKLTAATAPWPFIALAYASRHLEPRHPALAGAALGSTAGAWAAVMVELWCPLAVPNHVAIGHVLPLVLLSIAGAIYGAWKFGLRRVE